MYFFYLYTADTYDNWLALNFDYIFAMYAEKKKVEKYTSLLLLFVGGNVKFLTHTKIAP